MMCWWISSRTGVSMALRADMRLALVAAIQVLPPRQRAVLLLREVLEFSAAEVAAQFGSTVPAVNSALQRARAALAEVSDIEHVTEPDDPQVKAVIEGYVRAFEAADVPALVQLVTDEAVLEMPPVPLWYQGSRDYGLFMRRVFKMRGPGWVMRYLTANGQRPARAGRVRAGSRPRASTAFAASLHGHRRPGSPQCCIRRPPRVCGVRLARTDSTGEFGRPR
jgi:RNA polymerase sigma-70 factor, ECF subfamily